jgi:hypothetical protein
MNIFKCVDSLQIQYFILKTDQNFNSTPNIKISHSLALLYSKLLKKIHTIMYIITHLYVVKDS